MTACYTWLYAVLPAGPGPDPGPAPSAGPGVADEPPRAVAVGGLRAVVGTVPSADFDTDALHRRLADPRRLEHAVRAHHRIVDAVTAAGPALPVRFGTVYRDDDRVRALLTAHGPAFRAALDRVADRTEWGVKAYLDARPDDDEQEPGAGAAADRPGTAYLLRRRAARDRGARLLAEADERARQLHLALSGYAAESVRHPPQPPEASGDRAPMVLNGAYLVERAREAEFARAVREWGEAHGRVLRLGLTGPWPPYSFVDLPTGTAADGEGPP